MQFFFCASSGLAHAGAESMQAVTIVARRNVFMGVQGVAAHRRSATISITGPGLHRLTAYAPRRLPSVERNCMLFVVIGVVLILLNLADVGVFGTWNWEVFG